jgi:hypothetical protein
MKHTIDSDEAPALCKEIYRTPERAPFLLRDGTPLRRDKFCDRCGWGNRPVAAVCLGCDHGLPRQKVRRDSDSVRNTIIVLELLANWPYFFRW